MTNLSAVVSVVLVAICCASQTPPYGFRAIAFFADYLPGVETCMQERSFAFEPFAVDFYLENAPFLLLVSNGWLQNMPTYSIEDGSVWYGNSTDIFVYVNAKVSDFTVQYSALVGAVTDHAYQYTECTITANNTGYIVASSKELAKDYTGTNLLYLYPTRNWALIVHTIARKSYGTWDISASCPGADSRLVSALVDTVKKADLVKQRDVFHFHCETCANAVLPQLDAADYFIE